MGLFILVTCASVLAFAATDLILPAIPGLPAALGGTTADAQYVLAAYTAGVALGLVIFGEIGARIRQKPVLASALIAFGLTSFAASQVHAMPALIVLRFVQGAMAAAAAVFAPGIIRTVFAPHQAVRAIGLQGSVEALAPALAPIAGAWLLSVGSWTTSFMVLGTSGIALGVWTLLSPDSAFPVPSSRGGSFVRLLRIRRFVRHGLSQALTLGALLVIVMGAPAVIVHALGGELIHFITMQVAGVSCYIVTANLSARLAARFGTEQVIMAGSALSALGTVLILGYAMAGGADPWVLAAAFVPVNLGLGMRGPSGFYQAIVSGGGDDARAAALVILAVLLITAGGTAGVAPWIGAGLLPLATTASVLSVSSVLVLGLLKD